MSKEICGVEYPLSRIFSPEFDLVIPSYQRHYVWTGVEAIQLFSDLHDFHIKKKEGAYSLGRIILVKESGKPHAEVIDGQQRLATLTILLAALANKAQGALRDIFLNYLYDPGNPKQGLAPRPRLKMRERDQDFFRSYVQEMDFDSLLLTDPAELTRPQRKIQANAWLFVEMLNGSFGEDQQALAEFGETMMQRCVVVADEIARQA